MVEFLFLRNYSFNFSLQGLYWRLWKKGEFFGFFWFLSGNISPLFQKIPKNAVQSENELSSKRQTIFLSDYRF